MELVANNSLVQKYVPPFLLNSKVYDIFAEQPLLEEDVAIPLRTSILKCPSLFTALTEAIQQAGHLLEKDQMAANYHNQSLIEGTKPSIPRTPWAHLKVQWMWERMQ